MLLSIPSERGKIFQKSTRIRQICLERSSFCYKLILMQVFLHTYRSDRYSRILVDKSARFSPCESRRVASSYKIWFSKTSITSLNLISIFPVIANYEENQLDFIRHFDQSIFFLIFFLISFFIFYFHIIFPLTK